MKELERIESFKESCEKDVIGAVQGTYKFKKSLMQQKFDEAVATKKSLNWGISQVNKGIGKYYSWKDAENSLREMSKIAIALVDACEHVKKQRKISKT